MINVTIWHEYRHEKRHEDVRAIYPEGMHAAIKQGIEWDKELNIRLASLDDPDQGLPDDVLNSTDVLLWWGHGAHHEVADELADRIVARVNNGMGFIALHSAHHSKPFRRLMGTTCNLTWRERAENARIWVLDRAHPIMQGIGPTIEIQAEEMYGEVFEIPQPDELLAISWWKGGEVFRSACTWKRGNGKIFYFQPGHETFRSYYHPDVLRVIDNAIHWAAPVTRLQPQGAPAVRPAEDDIHRVFYPEDFGGERVNFTKPHVWKSTCEDTEFKY